MKMNKWLILLLSVLLVMIRTQKDMDENDVIDSKVPYVIMESL